MSFQVVFLSIYFNHHQKALCDAFYSLLGEGFTFVETMPMEQFRAGMGWGEDTPSYVLRTYESDDNEKRAQHLIDHMGEMQVRKDAPQARQDIRKGG